MGRYRSVSRLKGAFLLAARVAPALFVAACASAPPPAPLTEADTLLGRKEASDIDIARPELVAEARDLLRRAKAAHNVGDDERATLLAHQAIQLFTSAKNLVERSEAERLLRLVDKAAGESEEERKKVELEAKLRRLEEQSKSSPEAARAMGAIDRARDKQSTALEKGAIGGSAGVYFQQGQRLLEVAIDAFEAKSYGEATNAGQSAAASFSSAIGAAEKDKGREDKGAEAAKSDKPRTAEPAGENGREPQAEALAGQAKIEAKAALERAEEARGDAIGAGVATSAMIEADDALRMATRAFEGGQYGRTREKAAEARTIYQMLARRPSPGAFASGGAPAAGTSGFGGAFPSASAAGGAMPTASALRPLADKMIVELELRRAEALGELMDQRCPGPFREVGAMLELAQKRFVTGDYEHAYEYALRADERFRACDKLTMAAPAQGAAASAAQASAKRAEDAEDAARKKAIVAIQKAQVESARAQAVNPTDPGVLQGNLLLSNADGWLGKKSYDEAEDFANRALAVLSKVKAPVQAEAAAPKPAAPPEGPKTTPAPAAAKPAPPRADGTPESAKRAIEEARLLRSRVMSAGTRSAQSGATIRAERLLENAEASLRRGEHDAAGQDARAASELYALALESPAPASPAGPAAPSPSPMAPTQPTSIVVQAPPVAPAPPGTTVRIVDERSAAREDQFLEARLAQMQQSLARLEQQQQTPVDPSWRPAYEKIFRALSLRDRARLRSPDARKKLDTAEDLLQQARAAWQGKRYSDAMRLAEDASTMLAPLAEATAESGTAEEIEARARKADELIREASVGQQVCEKEACGERDLAGYAAAKEMLASARQAYVDKRYAYALELADKAKQSFSATLLKPKKDAPDPKIESEKLEALKQEADATLREANISKKICDTKACRATDGEGWIRATEYMASAQAAYVDKRYDVAKELADKADKLFKYAIAMQPEFMVPPSVTKVTRSGSQLRLNPPLKFSKGTTLGPQSEASIAELAKTLIENKEALKKVVLIGYTDNRGVASTNKKLSADRAAVLREALIKLGVSADLLVAEGRGGENPIGDNATQQGREDNRRIEIVIELVEGAK